jgi:VWFA-related protein
MCDRGRHRKLWILYVAVLVPAALNAQQAASPVAHSATGPYTLEAHAPLVLEDLVVLDRNGQPVRGLKASDLTVTENGKPVTVQHFEEHTAQQSAGVSKLPELGPNVFTNMIAAPSASSLNILLLDALNTPLTGQASIRQQMLEYLKTLPPGLSMAVFGLGSHLYMLQGFTTDPKMLAGAIEASKKAVQASGLLDNPVSGEPAGTMSQFMQENVDLGDGGMLATIANLRQFELEHEIGVTDQRVQYTLQALNQLARYLASLPGRKNLIWFSGSFPLNFTPDITQENPFRAVADYQDDVRKTTDLLVRSQVAVYPIDGRGLFTNPDFNASQSDKSMARMFVAGAAPPSAKTPGRGNGSQSSNVADQAGGFTDSLRHFERQLSAEHATMTMIAENTGGKAYFDTNGLKEAVEKAIGDGSNYYAFSYTPPDERLDGSYRRIEVKVNEPGMHLSYRETYFADDLNEASGGKKVLPQSAMQAAMMRGSPGASQILFSVQANASAATVDKITKGAKPEPKLMKPPYRSYDLLYAVDVHDVAFTATADGVRHGTFEFAAVVYDDEGAFVNQTSNRISLDMPADRYAQILERGLRVGQVIEAPDKGDYFLRVAVQDIGGDRIGAAEISLKALRSKQAIAK